VVAYRHYNIADLISKVSEEVAIKIGENCRRRQLYIVSWNFYYREESPRITAYTSYFQKLESQAYILATDSMVYLDSNFCSGLQKTHRFCNRVRIARSRSSKVDNFGTNRKRVCDFLLVRHSNYGPILHLFW